MGIIDAVRKWIDGEGMDDPLAQVDENAQPRRVWEEFFVRIAREIEAVMQREMFTPPGGPTYIPREYIVYLNAADDHEWRGEKRRGLEQGLFHILSGRARELSGHTQLATKSFAVELRVDGTLNKGEFRVQPVWDSSEESGHTMVTARPAAQPPLPQLNETELPGNENEPSEGEVTQVRPRPVELYSVEVWHNGVRQTVMPVMKQEATIGRGSRSMAVDVPLKGDPEVSRLHAILFLDGDGKHWLTAKGRNPTLLSGREAPREERVPVAPDDKIDICSYTLRIQPK